MCCLCFVCLFVLRLCQIGYYERILYTSVYFSRRSFVFDSTEQMNEFGAIP